ncbi:MAG: ISL3 family transposase [Sulfuricurvum sp.]|nr:ISL3 family transposase [Sulfuricurvum sp.]
MPLLNLPHYTSSIIEETDHDIHIQIVLADTSKPLCPECQSKDVQANGKRHRHYMDIPIRGKRVGLNIDVQRYRCKSCKKTFSQVLPLMSEERKMTERLEQYIKKHSVLRPYAHIAKETGVCDATVYDLFVDHRDSMEKKTNFVTPKIMGIDEIHLAKQARCVITNIEERTIIEMLRDRNKPTVIKYLKGIENPRVILNVAMDMWTGYKNAVHEVLPHAIIVVDKFHVVKMANSAVEKCRKEVRASMPLAQRRDLKNDRFIMLKRESQLKPREQFLLSHWKLNYPLLGEVYDLKEAFYGIYDAKDGKEAYDRFNQWENGLTENVRPYFHDLHRAVTNWHKEIFSYFEYPVTNAYTESMNSVIRHIDRMGRSYGFESIRAKVLYSSNIHLINRKPKFNKKRSSSSYMGDDMVMERSVTFSMSKSLYQNQKQEFEEINYGVSIDKLAEMLESGKLQFDV